MLKHQSIIGIYSKNNNIFNILFNSISHQEFQKKINSETDNYLNYDYPSKEKLLGDFYEIFIECFLTFYNDNRIKIRNYEPIKDIEDNGVDGISKGTKGQIKTIQIKYRTNPTTYLKSEDLKQFGFQSIVKYGVDFNDTEKNMVLVTNCEGMDFYTEKNVFLSKIEVINGNNIDLYVNTDRSFWISSLDKINERINHKNSLFKPKSEYVINNEIYITYPLKEGEHWILINKKTNEEIKLTNEEIELLNK